jgi:hypothetical protein
VSYIEDDDDGDDAWAGQPEELDESVGTCTACGADVLELADQCPACGHWQTREDLPRTGDHPRWVVAAAWLCLALILAGFVFFLPRF